MEDREYEMGFLNEVMGELQAEFVLDPCVACGVDIYTSDPHEIYVERGSTGEIDENCFVFLSHYDCSPDTLKYERLLTEKPFDLG